jgi:hypothetical protein
MPTIHNVCLSYNGRNQAVTRVAGRDAAATKAAGRAGADAGPTLESRVGSYHTEGTLGCGAGGQAWLGWLRKAGVRFLVDEAARRDLPVIPEPIPV